MHSKFRLFVPLLIMIFLFQSVYTSVQASVSDNTNVKVADAPDWIIKWKTKPDPYLIKSSAIVLDDPTLQMTVARPKAGYETQQWLHYWQHSPYVKYIQVDHKVKIASVANDPMLEKQEYLTQIHAREAWSILERFKTTQKSTSASNTPIIIASVDTGVDFNHPDLIGHITDGINLINPETTPMDDNGHGTEVAGILVASMNNNLGVAGLVSNASIMPIKALDGDGTGSESRLVEGIRYAVDHKAKIIDLSVGLVYYTKTMQDVVQYAEDHGVLLVAASGNEGNSVKYPAAYPTVVAVGGVNQDNQAEKQSNYGPELDVVAPWTVFTTTLGGGYDYVEGTSMSAPQVAGVAALILEKYPDFNPSQIRSLLRQTAQDLNTTGWDEHTGFGLIRPDLALKDTVTHDVYKQNNTMDTSEPLSTNMLVNAQLGNGKDQDWFYLDAPYDGTIEIKIAPAVSTDTQLVLTDFPDFYNKGTDYTIGQGQTIKIKVAKGRSFIEIHANDPLLTKALSYTIQTNFQIYSDAFEVNDRQYEAYYLPSRSQTITGTFDHYADQDWYAFQVNRLGTIQLKVSVNTERIDPNILIEKKGGKPVVIDRNGDGQAEETPSIIVEPGLYYFRISNNEKYVYPVVGQYTLQVDFANKYKDANEPNNQSDQATNMIMDTPYSGVFDTNTDQDWFVFQTDQESLLHFLVDDIAAKAQVSLTLYDQNMNEVATKNSDLAKGALQFEQGIPVGSYFIKLTSNQSFDNQMYHFQIHSDPLTFGYKDISGHWAEQAIAAVSDQQIMQGYGDYTFRPDRFITRAEAVTTLVKALGLNETTKIDYKDVSKTFWAYDFIAKATKAGWIQGYPDHQFAPSKPLTRMEMAVLIANVMKIQATKDNQTAFGDITSNYWGAAILNSLKSTDWIRGFNDGTFRPNEHATRAQFATLLEKILNEGKK